MAKLYLKGVKNPITITTTQANNLNKIFDDETISENRSFNINGLRFSKEDIKYIIENDVDDTRSEISDNRKQENDAYYADIINRYNAMVRGLCGLSVEKKAKDTRLYELAWSAFTQEPITQEFLSEIVKRQTAFFEKNPKHPYASINILDLLPRQETKEDSIKEVIPSFMSNKIDRIIGEAYTSARYMKLI